VLFRARAVLTNMATICLCMILKNESTVIKRALESVIPIIDTWTICDTGSTDGTQDIVREVLKDIPGTLHEVPWVNFGVNRTQVITLAKATADYLLILDADRVLVVTAPFKDTLTEDCYELRYQGVLDYTYTCLLSTRHDWFYVGVTHEYIHSHTAKQPPAPLPAITIIDFCDGGSRADKFTRDVELLTASVTDDPQNARDVFYLAQTYKDLGRHAEALTWYERRVMLGGWPEEVFYAMYQVGRMQQAMGIKWEQVLMSYLRAYGYRPTRMEPLLEIVRHYREAGQFEFGFTFAAIWGHGIPYPTDRLFIDKPVYDYLLPFEFGICAAETNRLTKARMAFTYLDNLPSLPQWLRSQVDEWFLKLVPKGIE